VNDQYQYIQNINNQNRVNNFYPNQIQSLNNKNENNLTNLGNNATIKETTSKKE
jgi:hypothetical protein